MSRSASNNMSLNTTSPFNIWVTEMIYISAVGMINALGSDNNEIAANPDARRGTRYAPSFRLASGHPHAVLAGVDGELRSFPMSSAPIVRAIINYYWRR